MFCFVFDHSEVVLLLPPPLFRSLGVVLAPPIPEPTGLEIGRPDFQPSYYSGNGWVAALGVGLWEIKPSKTICPTSAPPMSFTDSKPSAFLTDS